LAIIPTGMP